MIVSIIFNYFINFLNRSIAQQLTERLLCQKKGLNEIISFHYSPLIFYYFACFSLIAACAAASLAIGTLNGEQDT